MKPLLRRFAADESGATAIEYALIGTLVSVAIAMWAEVIGFKLNNEFTDISTKFRSN
ncbi:MAG: Flp family type IVb pilin [Rhizobiales bacterium]|nr:Flp family type IVb pilin [Hyphomicrobiales bacterium]